MNDVLRLVTAQAVQAHLRREGPARHKQAVELVEQIADWRMRTRLWSRLHRRYIEAIKSNDWKTGNRLYWVLLETRLVVKA